MNAGRSERVIAADYTGRFAQQSVLVTQFASFQCF